LSSCAIANSAFYTILADSHLCWRLGPVLPNQTQARGLEVLTDPHTGKAPVIANQSRNMRSNTRRSVNSAVRAAYRSLAAFFIDLRPK
jgi:hypothetical protein